MAETLSPLEFEPAPELTRKDFAMTAEDILDTFAYGPERGWTTRELHEKLTADYVRKAEHPRLAALADVLISADTAAHVQDRLQNLKDTNTRSEHFKKFKDLATDYNHRLRELIDTQPRLCTRAELTGWLERASQDEAWTRSVMRGICAEVAVSQRLDKLPNVTDVRYSTLAEEPLGIDLVATLEDGRTCAIDVKCGGSMLVEVEPTTSGVRVQVEDDLMKGFGIDPKLGPGFDMRLLRSLTYARRG